MWLAYDTVTLEFPSVTAFRDHPDHERDLTIRKIS